MGNFINTILGLRPLTAKAFLGERYADYHITSQADAGGYGFHGDGRKTDFSGGNEEAAWEASDL